MVLQARGTVGGGDCINFRIRMRKRQMRAYFVSFCFALASALSPNGGVFALRSSIDALSYFEFVDVEANKVLISSIPPRPEYGLNFDRTALVITANGRARTNNATEIGGLVYFVDLRSLEVKSVWVKGFHLFTAMIQPERQVGLVGNVALTGGYAINPVDFYYRLLVNGETGEVTPTKVKARTSLNWCEPKSSDELFLREGLSVKAWKIGMDIEAAPALGKVEQGVRSLSYIPNAGLFGHGLTNVFQLTSTNLTFNPIEIKLPAQIQDPVVGHPAVGRFGTGAAVSWVSKVGGKTTLTTYAVPSAEQVYATTLDFEVLPPIYAYGENLYLVDKAKRIVRLNLATKKMDAFQFDLRLTHGGRVAVIESQ
jgi:hypothetical protein